MMDKWKSTKVGKVHSDLDCNKSNVHLACPIDMAEVLEAWKGGEFVYSMTFFTY